MIAVGSDKTSVFIQFLIPLSQVHPEVQNQTQQEIDKMIGLDRMPVMDNIERLLYVQAVLNEVGSTNCSHTATEDIQVIRPIKFSM